MKKSWRGLRFSIALGIWKTRAEISITPFGRWNKFLFQGHHPNKKMRIVFSGIQGFMGPLHLWSMSRGPENKFKLEFDIGFSYNICWNQMPRKMI